MAEPFSTPDRLRALVLTSSFVTVGTRPLFLQNIPHDKESSFLTILKGTNELRHTLAKLMLRSPYEKRT